MLEIIGAILGLTYIYLEYRASIHLWIVGAIMPLVYTFVYFQADLYAQGSLQLFYVAAAIYGWGKWRKKRVGESDDSKEIPITRISLRWFKHFIVIAGFIAVPLSIILKQFNDPITAGMDAVITGLSLVAMLMLAMKVAEQWLMWFIVDVICVIFYLYLSINTDTNLYATAGLYTLYSILAIVGYQKWIKLAEEQKNQDKK